MKPIFFLIYIWNMDLKDVIVSYAIFIMLLIALLVFEPVLFLLFILMLFAAPVWTISIMFGITLVLVFGIQIIKKLITKIKQK